MTTGVMLSFDNRNFDGIYIAWDNNNSHNCQTIQFRQ
jgi:hypothetical protein